jgi:hypothetical protein
MMAMGSEAMKEVYWRVDRWVRWKMTWELVGHFYESEEAARQVIAGSGYLGRQGWRLVRVEQAVVAEQLPGEPAEQILPFSQVFGGRDSGK